jgi:hypothetical protein
MSAENYVEAVKRYQVAVAGQMHEVECVLSNFSSFCFRRFTGCRFASLIVHRNEIVWHAYLWQKTHDVLKALETSASRKEKV